MAITNYLVADGEILVFTVRMETISRQIDDCGCGQKQEHKPYPDNWVDYERDCSNFKDGWRCVCPGKC